MAGRPLQSALCHYWRQKQMPVVIFCTMMIWLLSNNALAATSQTALTEVTLNIADAIEVISWPDAAFVLHDAAIPGQPVVSGALPFTVRCNANWGIQVKSDDAAGKLREYSPATGQYVSEGRISQRSLEWSTAPGGPWLALSSANATIVTNQGPSGEIGANVSLYLRYTPGFNDVPLSGGRMYRITLTYTAAVGY